MKCLACKLAHHGELISKPGFTKECKLCNKTMRFPGRLTSRQEHKKFCSRRCAAIYGTIHSKKKSTGIEIKLGQVLDELKIPYKTQKHIHRITVPDFFIEPNITLYADGFYWHNLPRAQARDAKINKKLTELGYKVIRFWEQDINNNINMVKEKLASELAISSI